MQVITLDGSGWRTTKDFFDALASALGSFEQHGRNSDAFLETMIYCLELNEVQPPYEVAIIGAPDALRPFLEDFASWVAVARQDRANDAAWGGDVEVIVTVA